MFAIETKYLGPTDHKGARIKVKTLEKAITINWDYAADIFENHVKAATALLKENFDLTRVQLATAASIDGKGYVHVVIYHFDPDKDEIRRVFD